jgi:hypothetical protein
VTLSLRRPAAAAVLLVGTLLSFPGPSSAAATETCAPTPKTAASICLTYDFQAFKFGTTTPTRNTQEPVDVGVSFQNTSTGYRDEAGQPRWLTRLSANLVSRADMNPLITGSAQLPDGLLVSGSAAPCAPGSGHSFTACTAGRGTGFALGNGNLACPDVCDMTFGIQKIVNERDGLGSHLGQFKVTLDVCLKKTVLSLPVWSCDQTKGLTQTVTIDRATPGQPTFNLTMPATALTQRTTIDQAFLFIRGLSDQLVTGPADKIYTVAKLPMRCGFGDVSGSARSVGGTQVTVSKQFEVRNCAQLDATASRSRVTHGGTATVSGKLYEYNTGIPMISETLQLRACSTDAVEPCSATPVTTVVQPPTGRYSFTVKPSRNTRYFVQYAGYSDDPVFFPGSWVAKRIDVAPKVTRTVSRTTMPSGGTLKISGSVAPRHDGKVVNIQRLSAGVWKTISRATLTSRSTYAKSLVLRGSRRSTAQLRVVLPAHSDHVIGISPTVAIRFS